MTASQGLVATPRMPPMPPTCVSALMATSLTPKSTPLAAPSITPWCSAGAPARGPMIRRPPTRKSPASKAIIAGRVEGGVRAVRGGQRDGEQDQARGGEAEPCPLAPADLEAEEAVGHHGDQDDPAGEHDLDHRHRGHRQRGDVEAPGAGGHEHAEREPLRRVQRAGRAQRVTDVDRGRLAGAAVLEEEPEVRNDRAEQREQDAELNRHERV